MKVFIFFIGMILMTASPADNSVHKQDNSAYDYSFQTLTGHQPLPLSEFKGKVVLVVNTASKCGFTGQYSGLETLYNKYKDRGLVILGVPSNDFGKQEPGSSEEIASFCKINYGVTFPMTAKEAVTGKTHILFLFGLNRN